MKKVKLIKFVFTILINYFILGLSSLAISYYFKFTLKDTSFIIGLIIFIIELCINISGNPMGLSLQSFGNSNSQYVSNVDFKTKQHENENNKAELNINNLINSTLLFSSILILITSYYL